jgi:hypothetical protein
MGGRIMAQNVHIPAPGICEYVMFYSKEKIADGIKFASSLNLK